ncbi:CheR family methyltransferase [Aeromonas bivalvium]|uniref:CheR family methyltransferase n=1 Tax=Aeromonas bivalvium TaxID=440079 RepID=UPI0005A73981|nr:protein-glutamate O-methyltransferase CheR [Aeromonas bivalvium]
MLEHAVLSDQEFCQFQRWLHQTAGIDLSPAKKTLVSSRLAKRLSHYQLPSFGDYFRLIMHDDAKQELQLALDLLTTNETYFFREPKHFEFLSQQVLPGFPQGRPLRIWSAASSSGEEAYSLAMTLAERRPSAPWEILASDISSRVLAQARAGLYAMDRANNIPLSYLMKYCLKGIGLQEGTFLIDRTLRERVQFRQINLSKPLPELGQFDLIFIRNVMIYFNRETKVQVMARLEPLLRRGGYLIISHAESLHGMQSGLQLVSPSIYRKP